MGILQSNNKPLSPGPRPEKARRVSARVLFIILGFLILATTAYLLYNHWHSSNSTKQISAKDKPIPVKSPFWAGYLKYSTANSVKQVDGDWTVPQVESSNKTSTLSVWTGIGGYVSQPSLQIGTSSKTGPNNGTPASTYDAYWQCAPGSRNSISNFRVNAGDKIQANITSKGTDWALILTDKTSNQNFQKNVPCSPDLSTTSWVLENTSTRDAAVQKASASASPIKPPSTLDNSANTPAAPVPQQVTLTQSVPLAKFTNSSFSNLKFNGLKPGIGRQIQFVMINGNSTVAAPSTLTTNGNSFTIKDSR